MTDETEFVILRPKANEKSQAADWLAKLDRGNLTPEEHAAFTRWLAEDPKNRDAIKNAAAFWYGLNAPLSQLQTTSRKIDRTTLPFSFMPAIFTRFLVRFRVAAVVTAFGALVAIAPIYYYASLPKEETGYFTTRIGEARSVSLADGSDITLNTNSIVEQDFSRKERVVRLIAGEAIFDVAHDKRRPFFVYAADSVIRAVGTRFAVRVEPDRVRVMVTEGRIALQQRLEAREEAQDQTPTSSPSRPKYVPPVTTTPMVVEPVMIDKGEVGEIDRTKGATRQAVSKRELAEQLSWTQGQLVFYDKELQSVIDEVARYTTITIRIEGEALKRKKITGILQIGNIDLMLDGIEGSLGIRVDRVSPNLVYLSAG